MVATPIGHLDDLTRRAATVLASVPVVAAEDTRVTRTLLAHLGARPELWPAHAHNEAAAAARVVARLRAGDDVALVSDAGTPAISDPGARLVEAVHAAGLTVVPVPGPSALAALLSVAGLPQGPVHFEGFLPARPAARDARLATLARSPAACVLYEAPHRIEATLGAIRDACGDTRLVVVGRELTKQFEELFRGPAAEALGWLDGHPHRRRGEFVVAFGGAPPPAADGAVRETVSVPVATLLAELSAALPAARAARIAARLGAGTSDALYARLVAQRRAASDDAAPPAGEAGEADAPV